MSSYANRHWNSQEESSLEFQQNIHAIVCFSICMTVAVNHSSHHFIIFLPTLFFFELHNTIVQAYDG